MIQKNLISCIEDMHPFDRSDTLGEIVSKYSGEMTFPDLSEDFAELQHYLEDIAAEGKAMIIQFNEILGSDKEPHFVRDGLCMRLDHFVSEIQSAQIALGEVTKRIG